MGIADNIRRHLVDGKLPEDYTLPKQKPFQPQTLTEAQIKSRLRGVVRAVHRPEWLRLRFNAAERRMFLLANTVPVEFLKEPLKEAFLSRGDRLDVGALGGFTAQCIDSRNAETVKCGLILSTILPYPKTFMAQPIPTYLWAIMYRNAQYLRAYPDFRTLAEESIGYLSGVADPKRNPPCVSR